MKNTEPLFYEFNCSKNKFKHIIADILLVPSVSIFVYSFIKVFLLDKLIQNQHILYSVGKITFVAVLILISFLTVKYENSMKGVFVYDDFIQIIYAITKINYFNIKPIIKYDEIKEFEAIEKNFRNSMKYNISFNYIAGKGDEYIRLITNSDKEFYFAVKNQEDFIKQVNLRMERIKFLEKYNLNSVIAARGISPEQIKFRWKSQDELDSAYYIDYQGNIVELPLPDESEQNKSEN